MNTQPTHTIEPTEARLNEIENIQESGFLISDVLVAAGYRCEVRHGKEAWSNGGVWESQSGAYDTLRHEHFLEAISLARTALADNARLRSERTEALNIIANLEQANLLAAKRVGMELRADTPNVLAGEILKLRSERDAALAFANEAEAIFDGELGEWADHYGRAFELLSNVRSLTPQKGTDNGN